MNIVYCLVSLQKRSLFCLTTIKIWAVWFLFWSRTQTRHKNVIVDLIVGHHQKKMKFWARLSDTRKPPQLSIVSCIQLKKGGCNSVLSVTLFLTLYPTSFSFSVCHLGGRIYPLIDFVPVGNFYKLLTKLSPAQSNFNSFGLKKHHFQLLYPPPSTQEVLRRRFHYLKICLFDPPWLMTN